MLNDFVSCTSELEFSFKDISATEVLELLLYFDNDREFGVYYECIKLRNLEQTCVLTCMQNAFLLVFLKCSYPSYVHYWITLAMIYAPQENVICFLANDTSYSILFLF